MTTFPDRLRVRAASLISASADLATAAHVRINALGSVVSSLTPGDWQDITLSAGWSNLAGYIPAQAQIARLGAAQIVGHITGGTTTDGTVIGTLATGYYNTSFAHKFTVNVMSGASAVSTAGTLSSTAGNLSSSGASLNSTAGSLNSGAGVLNDIAGDLNDGTVHGSAFGSLSVSTGTTLHQNGTTLNSTALSLNSGAVTLNSTALNLNSGATSTPVNYNTALLELNTSGQLILFNCPASATQISFNETLPLIGS